MKKIRLLLLALLGFIAITVQGQILGGITIGPQIPMGDLSDGFKVGFGFHVVGKYMLKENMAVGLNLGYSKFGSDYEGVSCSFMPITGLFEYHFGTGNIKPYVGADLGLYNVGAKVKYMGISSSDSEIHLGFAPTGGVLYGLTDLLSLCGNLKYNLVFQDETSSFLGINVGVIYKIK
jgi:hypothetical protein